MASTAHLEVVVTSSGVQSADRDLKQLTATSKETEKQHQHMADVFAEIAAAEARETAKAVAASEQKAVATEKAAQRAAAAAARQAQQAAESAAREDAAWNDAKQKALAYADRKAEAAEKAAARQMAAADKAAKREDELWNNAIQRAKAGLDGVLPIRPSLQRIEANQQASSGGALAGAGEGAMSALGLGALAGGAAGIAAVGVEKLFSTIESGKDKVIEAAIEISNLEARITGVTGSVESANDKFEELESMTLGKLPSTVREVAEAFVFLGNTGLNNSREALKSYSNIAAQTGHSLGEVTSAVEHATQGSYRGLREYGIKVKEEGDNLAVTFHGQTETIANNAEAIEGYMQSLGNVEFAGAVDRQMDTIGGAVKRTHDAWEKLIDTIAESSLGSLIQSTVGASTSVIDIMTSSVEALFDKVHKSVRELEADKARAAEQSKLDKTMASWADPTASRSEVAQLAARLEAHAQSSADKALAQYAKNEALIAKLTALGESHVGDMTLAEAQAENERQYRRDNGGDKTKREGYAPKIAEGKQTNYAAYTEMVGKQEYEQYLIVRDSLNKQEDAERASYEKRREFLIAYTGPDSEELWAKNSLLWDKHLDDIAGKSAKAQLELQKRLQNIGIGPQSQMQVINRKTAGQHNELEGALSDNLNGKNGEVLKLAAEQTYAAKSIAIEKARTAEIKKLNMELAAQSTQNAAAMFGSLAAVMKNAHGEQSKEYRTMFDVQRAFGIASAEIAMLQSMAEASKQPYPANIPLYLKAAAQGAGIVAQISNTAYSGSYDSGGTIYDGSSGDVAERRPELVMLHGRSRVQGPATVIGGADTAALLGGGKSAAPNISVHLHDDINGAFDHYMSSTRGSQAMNLHIKRNSALIRSITG